MEDIEDITPNIDGFLTNKEGKFLYHVAKNCRIGVIVEIGSFKGKSTIWLAKGSKKGSEINIYAIDPHTGSPEHKERYGNVWTFEEFKKNIKNEKVDDIVIPIVKTSEEAEKDWDFKPIEFLWIDGNHEYEMVKLDYEKWSPYLIDGGIIAFHDTTTWIGPSKVVEENLFKSKTFIVFERIDSITFAQKVKQNTSRDRLRNRWLLSNHLMKIGRRFRKDGKQEAKEYLLNAVKCMPVNIRAVKELMRVFMPNFKRRNWGCSPGS